jgi:hypothetical protein
VVSVGVAVGVEESLEHALAAAALRPTKRRAGMNFGI